MIKRFYKLNNIWYIDLPEYLDKGLGSLADLMMVDGADTFLDMLSNGQKEVQVRFSHQVFTEARFTLIAENFGKNQNLLKLIGHAPVNYGRYYRVKELHNHRLWLCPVTEYVFGGAYPDVIWVD